MRRLSTALFIISMLVCSITYKTTARETEDYVIDNYELTIKTEANSPDVAVTMDITYLIRSGKKSTGFKYIGAYWADSVIAYDEEGNQIETTVEQQREFRIGWSFEPVGPGKKRVIISFNILDAITGNREENTFEANWAGIFKVKANRAVYRFIFPDTLERKVSARPRGFRMIKEDDRNILEATQETLKERAFSLSFRPGIVDSENTISAPTESSAAANSNAAAKSSASTKSNAAKKSSAAASRSSSGSPSDKSNIPGYIVFAALIAGLIVIVRRAKRAGTSSSGGSTSSCAGGSSCSSSSCGGGGCGGGCGG